MCNYLATVLILIGCNSLVNSDDWLGQRVFYKDSAVVMDGDRVIDKDQELPLPVKVEEVKGDLLKLERFWVKKSDCMTLDQAFAYYSEELRKNPKLSRTWLHRGICWLEKGDSKKAIEDFDEAIRLDRKNATAYFLRGKARANLKDFAGSMMDHERAVQLEPELIVRDFDEAIRLDPESAPLYKARGNVKLELNDVAGAIKDYDEAIRLNPKDADAYNNRGMLKGQLQDFEAAIKDFDEAIQRDPDLAWAYNNRGIARSKLKDYEAAINDFGEAVRLAPDLCEAFNNRGLARSNLRDFAAAIKDYDAAISIESSYAKAYTNRGDAKSQLEDYAAAINDYDTATRLNPSQTLAKSSKAFLLATAKDATFRNPTKALELAEQVLRKDADDAYALNAKSCALAAKQDFEAAIRLQKSITDTHWLKDDTMIGGAYQMTRIAAWQNGSLWHPK
jgi:tetratricopeptide (TPR) repeat protein